MLAEYSYVECLVRIVERVELNTQNKVQSRNLKPESAQWVLEQTTKAARQQLTDSEVLSLLLLGIRVELPKGVTFGKGKWPFFDSSSDNSSECGQLAAVDRTPPANSIFSLNWQYNFQRLADFRRHYGNIPIPKTEPYADLWVWQKYQYVRYREGRLSAYEKMQLESIEFFPTKKFGSFIDERTLPSVTPKGKSLKSHVFDKFRLSDHSTWMERYRELQEFSEKHWHLRVPREGVSRELSHWLRYQKRKKYESRLYEFYEAHLRLLGVSFPEKETAI
nr:helicase associated domain-containing protein [Sneathiella limimaris]